MEHAKVRRPGRRQAIQTAAAPFSPPPVSSNTPPPALQDFLEWARTNSVRVVEAWPPLLDNAVYRSAQHQAYFRLVAGWYRSGGAIGLDDPTVFFLPVDKMFDYVLHANEKGRAVASSILAEQLRAAAFNSIKVGR